MFTENPDIMAHYKALLKGFNNMSMGYHKVRAFSAEDVRQIRGKIVYLLGNEDPFQKLGGKDLLLQNHMNAVFYDHAGHGLNHELSETINQKIIRIFQNI